MKLPLYPEDVSRTQTWKNISFCQHQNFVYSNIFKCFCYSAINKLCI